MMIECVLYCLVPPYEVLSNKLRVAYTWGIGRHMWDEPLAWLDTALKVITVTTPISWKWNLTLIT